MRTLYFALPIVAVLMIVGCGETTQPVPDVAYDATPYQLSYGNLPSPDLPTDYPLTVQRVALGRELFYDGVLSRTGEQSCASCHVQTDGFSDLRRYSIGVRGLPGKRQAMAVMNLAWHRDGFFWDGRAATLREQALHPIRDTLEMDETLDNVVRKLLALPAYTQQFKRAFGSDTITAERIGIALEQFMMSVVSTNSKLDRVRRGEETFTESELRGSQIFNREFDPRGRWKGGECFHCHAEPFFTNDRYINNGLDDDASVTDQGRFRITGVPRDMAAFKVPSLRNIAVTAPYMHDGRFATLEEVIDHYNVGVKRSLSVDPLLQYNMQVGGLGLNEQDKADLVAFMKTLTDDAFLKDPAYAKP
ncbi:MAG: cytochrome-c peroxidase [Candidatus Kapabacteria bacterium]|nr:cytochrome-c peroxidase [Candidatus Kapabacteria bacterium]